VGLDMYLNRKIFIWSYDRENLSITGIDKYTIDPKEVKEIVIEAGYWRKANAIHNWFVKNVQDGEDDCKDYYVSSEQMQELLDTVNTVLEKSELVDGEVKTGEKMTEKGWEPIMQQGKYIKDPTVAKELLPTTEGFFFGSADYDEYYYNNLVKTKEILEKALQNKGDDYEYHSSW
jgi:hypothetical protein